jgi:hypothetical protein
MQHQCQRPRLTCYSLSCLFVGSIHTKSTWTRRARLVAQIKYIPASFYSKRKRVLSVSLVEVVCNTSASDRDLPVIHSLVDFRIRTKLTWTRRERLVCINQTIIVSFYSNIKRVFSVSKVEWGNSRVSDRDLPVIHSLVECRIRTKSTWNTMITTS